MDLFTKLDLRRLLEQRRGPCLSAFMPTHRRPSEQDPVRGKNLLRSAEATLVAAGQPDAAVRAMLDPLQKLFADESFWKHQSDGLACFLAPGITQVFRLPVGFSEQVVVGSRFHLKALMPFLAGDGRFFVLAVSENSVRLFQGTAQTFDRVEVNKAPISFAQAMQLHDRDEPLTFHARPTPGGGWGAIFSGQGVGIDDHKTDLLRFCQQIDHGLHELLRTERTPLILASVESLWPIYRQANSYPHLLEQGIAGNADRLRNEELHERAWSIVRPHFQQAQRNAAALFQQLAGTGRTTNDLAEAVSAACQGRFEILFVASDQERWGTCSPHGSDVVVHDARQPGDEDLLNVAAMHTILRGGVAYAVPAAAVPGGGPIAGTYWLPLAKHR
ncbi:MAG TPA: hypothetical protein VFE62_17685 [Gemmataceae bacterium]|nr:hypothetical protein [Gemmataceae bacterium]